MTTGSGITLTALFVAVSAYIVWRRYTAQKASLTYATPDDWLRFTPSKVSDGDTIVGYLLLEGGKRKQVKVRVAGIDAPEKDQPGGKDATDALFQILNGTSSHHMAIVDASYGRDVAHVYANGMDVGEMMIEYGWAWPEPRYNRNHKHWSACGRAMDKKLGIWGLPLSQQVPPWDWRHSKK